MRRELNNLEDLRQKLGAITGATAQALCKLPADPTIVKRAADGDMETRADVYAGEFILEQLKRNNIPCSVLLEDTGTVQPLHKNPQYLLIIDELDGTRPTNFGPVFRGLSSVQIALLSMDDEPTVGNVCLSVVSSLDGDTYTAIKGEGFVRKNGVVLPPPMQRECSLSEARGLFEHTGKNGWLEGAYLQPLMPACKAGLLCVSSSSCGARLLVEGRTDFYTHFALRVYKDWPEFRKLNGTDQSPKGMMPYDIAPFYRLVSEAGITVTDSYGNSLDGLRMDGITTDNMTCAVASTSPALHKEIIWLLHEQMKQLRASDSFFQLVAQK